MTGVAIQVFRNKVHWVYSCLESNFCNICKKKIISQIYYKLTQPIKTAIDLLSEKTKWK